MANRFVQQTKSLINVPVFLAPAFSTTRSHPASTRLFSASSRVDTQIARGKRDKNRQRGVSVIRSTGPRQRLNVTRLGPLPKPVSDPTEVRASFPVNPNHGLWGFFNEERDAMIPPSEESSHGREWTKRELSRKSWEDLHRLYWVCVKEANIVHTRNIERNRLRIGYGDEEGRKRLETVKKTMTAIRQTLVERHYAHFDAAQLLNERFLHDLFPDVLQEKIDLSALEIESTQTDELPSEEPLLSPGDNLAESSTPTEKSSPERSIR